MIELHREQRGRDPRFLARRPLLKREGTDAEKAEAEEEQRDGNRQEAAERQEARGSQQHRRRRPAQHQRQLSRIELGEGVAGSDQQCQSDNHGEDIGHLTSTAPAAGRHCPSGANSR